MRDPAAHLEPGRSLDIRHVVIDDGDPHPSEANGLHIVVRRLAREQIASGDRAEIVFLHRSEKEAPAYGDVPTRALALEGGRIGRRILWPRKGVIAALLARSSPETVIHFHAAREPLLLAVSAALRRSGIRYAVTVHGRYAHMVDPAGQVVRRMPMLYLRLAERRVLERAHFVQGLTPSECALLRGIAPKARVLLLPNAAYSSRLDEPAQPRSERTGGGQGLVFGFCGRYEVEHKGLDLLLDGFARYRRDGGRGRLVLIGTGPGRGAISDRARALDLGAAIEINGPRFGTEKLAAMRLWDFFVQTSRFEAMPMGCLEAAYHGLPLIASVEAGLAAELGQHRAGITVSPLTAGAVAEALGYAERLSAAERSEMGRRAAEMAREIGDWTQIAAALRQLYCASAGRRPWRFAAWGAAAGVRPLRDEPDDRAP